MNISEDKSPEALKRESIIERIRKLQRMTQASGAAEQEALLAAQLVQKLIAEHQIAESELSLRADKHSMLKDSFTCVCSSRQKFHGLLAEISRLYGTIHWFKSVEEDLLGLGFTTTNLEVNFYGFPVDVAGSIATLAICITAIDSEIASLPRRTKAIARESFEIGMCERIIERLVEMKYRSMQDARGKGAIVLVKEELVKEGFAGLGIRPRSTRLGQGPLDQAWRAKGKSAGNTVALDRPLSPTQRTARLT